MSSQVVKLIYDAFHNSNRYTSSVVVWTAANGVDLHFFIAQLPSGYVFVRAFGVEVGQHTLFDDIRIPATDFRIPTLMNAIKSLKNEFRKVYGLGPFSNFQLKNFKFYDDFSKSYHNMKPTLEKSIVASRLKTWQIRTRAAAAGVHLAQAGLPRNVRGLVLKHLLKQ